MARKIGQIIRRGPSTWLVRIYVGRTPETRRRKYFGKFIHGGMRSAQAHLNRMLAERDLGRNIRSPRQTVGQYLDHWLDICARPRLRAKSFHDYSTLLARYVRPRLGERRFGELSAAEIQGLYGELLDRELSARTIRYTHAVLFSALRQAVRWKLLLTNPAEEVYLPRQSRRRFTVFDVEQARRFIASISGHKYEVLFALAITTGMRPSEYLALTWSDFDLERGAVSVSKTLQYQYLILIDDDHYDDTNLNRSLLAGWLDINEYKVHALQRALKAGGVEAFSFPGTIKSYVADARVGLRVDVAHQVDDLVFSAVASCVDKGAARQDVQGLYPGLLLGGSTFNLQAKSNLYCGRLGAACLACFNPAGKDGEKIRAFEDQLRKMPAHEQSEFLTGRGLDAKAIEEYLSGAQCGGLGEAALRDYVVRPPAEFSAGFVSLGSGLLLASTLLRNTIFSTDSPPRGDMTTLNFLNGGLGDSWLGADDKCQLNCQAKRAGNDSTTSRTVCFRQGCVTRGRLHC